MSGVNDSGPEKNFLIPVFSKIGNLFIAADKKGSKCSKFSGNSPNEKSLGILSKFLKAFFALGSNTPTNNFPASSFKYKQASKSRNTGNFFGKSFIGSVNI